MGNLKIANKERREIEKLVRMMREAGVRYRASKPVIELLEGGADEIERLAKENKELRNRIRNISTNHHVTP